MVEISLSNFGQSTYTSDRGKEYLMYLLTKEGCLCLVSGYDANLRMKSIKQPLFGVKATSNASDQLMSVQTE